MWIHFIKIVETESAYSLCFCAHGLRLRLKKKEIFLWICEYFAYFCGGSAVDILKNVSFLRCQCTLSAAYYWNKQNVFFHANTSAHRQNRHFFSFFFLQNCINTKEYYYKIADDPRFNLSASIICISLLFIFCFFVKRNKYAKNIRKIHYIRCYDLMARWIWCYCL